MSEPITKVDGATVRDDFNAINAVLHYTRAAHFVGLWKSELTLIAKYFPDPSARLLEAGCGAGRVAVGLWHQGYRDITGFDFASELVDQARNLAQEQGIAGLTFLQADATQLNSGSLLNYQPFDGVLFMFNGLMQIPGRENRRAALHGLHRLCRPGGHFIFTTHDRDDPKDVKEWAQEAERWAKGEQNPRLVEFGDRYFSDDNGNTFMHLPDRKEVLAELAATGWTYLESATRNELASETPKVRNFSDNCTFWVAKKL
ncbi:class I SAM-dependent methyltransferase [Opitutus sp. GAS368]|jgi:SAM-dependent methyltransferase|uniref:class I SAM-dependent methyltransferase n=1 Tax=Opitutus sp. GAS368 TaxID=1882749 RepID=UPI00087CB0CC|nr:class I SAM-dependent methyltransferase [Opitutus sp. GAS368]SDR70247.1 Methyltransferase domain-containing protein [Opitutus sp. GAS368]